MPRAAIPKAITSEQAANVLREQLGSDYKITSHGRDSLTVKHGSLALARVHLRHDGTVTTFHVHGGGLIIGRIYNGLGIARTVTAAIKEGLGSEPAN